MKRLIIPLLLLLQIAHAQTVSLVPQPIDIKTGKGSFTISKKTVIAARDEEDRKAARFLNDYLEQVYGFTLDIDKQESKDYIRLTTRKFIKAPDKDAYNLQVTKNGVIVEGDTYAGTFYGLQTLIQLLPTERAQGKPSSTKLAIPFVTVQDYPRFSYRGMHLDVCRHFFDVAFIKKYIDYIALHKMNYFHWHLTEDQGWRIEIKKYPKLNEVAAYRNGTITGRYPGTGNDNTRYGGYYTQEEVKEVVRYAADRHITVIPEVEMPGHSSAAIAAYPWLSCFPEKETVIPSNPSEASKQMKGKKVQETWGVFEDIYCAGNDSTFLFLQDVLDEVLALFPSTYIHVGGDEAPKTHWKQCPRCQARIKAMGLKDEHELQSYFIQRMEKYLNGKGRTLIGWDEILEGGLAPNAVVMSWRGEEGGINAARLDHQVIMTPANPVYFDYSQTRNEDSLVGGGFNPLEAVYAYEPVPKGLDSLKVKYILGAQANVWTEYMANPSKVEYMIFPRMCALAEVLWSPREKKNWTDFQKRLPQQLKRYDLWKANYSKAYYEVKAAVLPTTSYQGLQLTVTPRDQKGVIKYEIGNRTFTYSKPVILTRDTSLTVRYYRDNNLINTIPLSLLFNKATGKKISITNQPNAKYAGQSGAFSLVNGIRSNRGLSHPDWLGWIGDDLEATIDLGKSQAIDSVRLHVLDQNGSWVYQPQYVEVSLSTNGKDFTPVAKGSTFTKDTLTMGWITVPVPKGNGRFIKVLAKNYGVIPEGKPGGGNKAWLIVDEIQVM